MAMVEMAGLEKLEERANEALLDHFDWVCSEMTKQENTKRGVTKKIENDYNKTRALILEKMNGKRGV